MNLPKFVDQKVAKYAIKTLIDKCLGPPHPPTFGPFVPNKGVFIFFGGVGLTFRDKIGNGPILRTRKPLATT